ncbi:MAG: chemotaxis protein CheX [Burkholderiaceae bacterium]|nr:MAG: chemotaxis protein CheX [Burkholderiaceae bacterium]
MSESQLKIFIDAVLHYFSQMTQRPAEIKTSYLAEQGTPSFDYTGLITTSNCYRGCVYFTAPRLMLRQLLIEMREPDTTEANLLDAVGEIANTIAGNARRHFGEALEISVPVAFKGVAEQLRAAVRARPFVIVVGWCGHEAAVVVDIEADPASSR